jgi:hypothetical protein
MAEAPGYAVRVGGIVLAVFYCRFLRVAGLVLAPRGAIDQRSDYAGTNAARIVVVTGIVRVEPRVIAVGVL